MNGEKLYRLRKKYGDTQERLSEKLGVTPQAVSSWEREEFEPDLKNIVALSELYNVSVDYLMSEEGFTFNDRLFDEKRMYTYIKSVAKSQEYINTLKALEYAKTAHDETNVKRKGSDVPYINHPLTVCCNAMALNIRNDCILSACLLHDVVEDCDRSFDELPVDSYTRELVKLLTKEDDKTEKDYYSKIAENPDASLIKCIDRCNNLVSMSYGLSRKKKIHYIHETEKYILPLLKKIEAFYPNASWILKYHITSVLDIYKRML